MRHFRVLLIAALLGLTLFFNIERLDFGEENIVDIDSTVYVLGLLAIISVITFQVPRYLKMGWVLTMWAGIYLLVKVWLHYFGDGRPIIGGFYTYLSITELAFLLIVLWLFYKLAAALRDFELAVENITLSDQNGRIHQFDKANQEIQVEMFRSRHNHHPLSVIIVQPEAGDVEMALHRAVQEVQQAMMRNYVLNNMAQLVSNYLRRTDLVMEQRGKGRFLVLCPETTTEDAQLLMEYVQTITSQRLGINVACGAATFPIEAFTFEELLKTAEEHLAKALQPEEYTSQIPTRET